MKFLVRHYSHRILATGFIACNVIECNPSVAQITSPITTSELSARPIRVATVTCPVNPVPPPGAPAPSPLAPLLLPILLPPIIEAGFNAIGASLIAASGVNRQYQSLTGMTNSMFYKAAGSSLRPNLDCIHLTVEGNAQRTKPRDITTWANERLFEAMLRINYSPDGTAFFVEPLWVFYPKPILNQRALGVAIALEFKSPDNSPTTNSFQRESLLPVGKVACGKPGSRNVSYSLDGKRLVLSEVEMHNVKCGDSVSSPWVILPPSPEKITSSVVVPVVVRAALWEASDYSRLLNGLGKIIQDNKKNLATATISQIPSSIYPPNYQPDATLAVPRAEYITAKQVYAKLLQANRAGDKNCQQLLAAWSDMIAKSIAAKVQDELVNSPPNCQP